MLVIESGGASVHLKGNLSQLVWAIAISKKLMETGNVSLWQTVFKQILFLRKKEKITLRNLVGYFSCIPLNYNECSTELFIPMF